MEICSNCGRESPEGYRFCPHCGSGLGPPAVPEQPRIERRVVTVLFCDLVGFTTRSDHADPEDVRATLEPFHMLAKAEIERFEGTLDKFIGDAAMGVFGFPVAHEDDPERAVRAGLAILERVVALNERRGVDPLQVRVGIDTGEAVVTLGSGVQVGENVAGDVVNTASRLQGAAPVASLIVGETTYRATRGAVGYQELEPVIAKGKAEPLRVWRAIDIRPIPTISERPASTPFVGRRAELKILEGTLLRAFRDSEIRLVVVVGEAGVGKSRLVEELRASITRIMPDSPVQWRRGRCLPYGEGITFWALGEIVKGILGILDSDPVDERDARLTESLRPLSSDDAERAWLRAGLAWLVGGDVGPAREREESFAAWARLLEAVASREPLVILFEDLHWADPQLLAFLEYLAARPGAIPLLVITTARPSLHDRHPGGLRGADVLSLPPLGASETSTLLSTILPTRLSTETLALLLERSGGNPLYAEELARVLRDRQVGDDHGRLTIDAAELALPESLQSLIAARLDTLAPERKAVLQDASVIGKVFWSGAVAWVGGAEEESIRSHLSELAGRELVRPSLVSTVAEQAEYAFWHALVRDVAYAQLPRRARRQKHGKVAVWMESAYGERLADVAEILAYHATTALDLARASGETEGVGELERLAARYLRLAGARTLALDVSKAEAQLLAALELTPSDDPDRFRVLAVLGEAALHAGRLDEADARYQEAVLGLRSQGATLEAADAMTRRSVVLEYRGDTRGGRAVLTEAIGMLEQLPPGPELARSLTTSAGSLLVSGRYPEAIGEADRAIRLAEEVGEEEAAARAHGYRGHARAVQGDLEGIDEQRGALTSLRRLGVGRSAAIVYNNLAGSLSLVQGSPAALSVFRDGVAFARERGLREMVMGLENSMLTALFEVGDWDEVMRLGAEVVGEARRQGSGYDEVFAEADRAAVLALRTGADARDLCESVLERARPIEDVPLLHAALLLAAGARVEAGDTAGAKALVREAIELTDNEVVVRAPELAALARVAVRAGDVDLAERALHGTEPLELERYRVSHLAARAVIDEARGHDQLAFEGYGGVAGLWATLGHVLERGHALFGAGRCLRRLGRAEEACGPLAEAAEVFAQLGAEPSRAAARSLMA